MNFRILYFSFCLFVGLFSCEKYEDIAGYNEFYIKQGGHSSKGKTIEELRNTVLEYDVIFDESARYTLPAADQADINKLFGFADCNSNHHENSARFGWRWNNEQLEILAYNYGNGKRTFTYLTSFKLNTSYRMKIELVDDKYRFSIDGMMDSRDFQRGQVCNKGLHYLLFPYFGGNQPAPHDIRIYMRRVF